MIILSIVYHEPEWLETSKCIQSTGLPVHYVERNPKGVGSLSEAINRGIKELQSIGDQYIWIVTNITFEKDLPLLLMGEACKYEYDVLHPKFESDHIHMRGNNHLITMMPTRAPFVEFTAALCTLKSMVDYPLDESMPYWGMDLDHGYRLNKAGIRIGVSNQFEIGHTYIRYNAKQKPNKYTKERLRRRRMTDESTRKALQEKYGKEWRDIVFPKTPEEIGAFYEKVKQKIGV